MTFPGNGHHDDVRRHRAVGVRQARDAMPDLGSHSGGAGLVAGSEDDALAGHRESYGQPAALLAGTTQDTDDEVSDVGQHPGIDTHDVAHTRILPAAPGVRHDGSMDAQQVAALRELLSSTAWVDRTRAFARTMRRSTTTPHGLLVVGTPDEEPWHLTAHLSDEARFAGIPELAPTLVRWKVPDDAPEHLRVTLARLEAARRGETVLVVAEDAAPESLLERAWDARKLGATVLALDGGDTELQGVAHEALTVVTNDLVVPGISFESVQHLVSAAAGETGPDGAGAAGGRRGFRDRLGRLLDVVSGPSSR